MTDLLPPGAPPREPELAASLAAALAAKGPGYDARTHHKRPDGSPVYANRLVRETSPYLLQHAHNPVDWWPWGDEAFAEARRLGRPVFLSIGYSTCHWCHVMEEESFESEAIARQLNERFVCIKVDREERPDVDAVYMSAVQALTGSGGWPMSVWLTHDREPFYGGTYFPPRDGARGARIGFPSLCAQLHQVWTSDPAKVAGSARMLADAVRERLAHPGSFKSGDEPDPKVIGEVVAYFQRNFDAQHGGLKRAPKFPSNLPLRLLLRHARRMGEPGALEMATLTLEKMAAGGIYDHLAGGFARYSVDAYWLVPHFEKMLYDNAQLAVAYAEAYLSTRRPVFARVVRETLDYLLREMTSPEGGLYSATDADSEGEEGKFAVWSEAEIRAVVGADADRFCGYYGVTAEGNFEGHNILFAPAPDEAEHAALAAARQKLYDVRARRIQPIRDEKILAAWNGLAISALAVGGRVLAEPRWIAAAERAAEFVLGPLSPGGVLHRSHKDGRARQVAFLDDWAFVTQGLLDLYEATFERRWLEAALRLAAETDERFGDPAHGGWFMTGQEHEVLLAREKPAFDGAEPSGTSIATLNALRLEAMTLEARWRDSATRAFGCFAEALREHPLALTELLVALEYATTKLVEVVLVWPDGADAGAMQRVLADTFAPTHAFLGAPASRIEALGKLAAVAVGKTPVGGVPTAYVCERGACQAPITDPQALARALGSGPSFQVSQPDRAAPP